MVLTLSLASLARKQQPFQAPGWTLKERRGRKGWEVHGWQPECSCRAAEIGKPGRRWIEAGMEEE